MKRDVGIIGASGHAKVVIWTARACGLNVVAAYDDDPRKNGQSVAGVPVVGPITEAGCGSTALVMGIGSNRSRMQVVRSLPLAEWLTLVHPHAWVHETVVLGPGSVVFAGAAIQPEAKLGSHCIVNTGATVDHDCVIGDFVHLAPGSHLAGEVEIGEGVFMGLGSGVIQCLKVGSWSTVGAGGIVVRHLPANCVAVGTPAKPRPHC